MSKGQQDRLYSTFFCLAPGSFFLKRSNIFFTFFLFLKVSHGITSKKSRLLVSSWSGRESSKVLEGGTTKIEVAIKSRNLLLEQPRLFTMNSWLYRTLFIDPGLLSKYSTNSSSIELFLLSRAKKSGS